MKTENESKEIKRGLTLIEDISSMAEVELKLVYDNYKEEVVINYNNQIFFCNVRTDSVEATMRDVLRTLASIPEKEGIRNEKKESGT